jgi:hypothetical protein
MDRFHDDEPILHFNGCVSANAWFGDGSGFGVDAGVATILACMALVLHLAGALEGESARIGWSVCSCTAPWASARRSGST